MEYSNEPLYMQIYNKLKDDIYSGKYPKRKRLPTEQELCFKYHVSRITSKKALNMLADEKLIVRIKGKGSYVAHSRATKSSEGDNVTNDKANKAIGLIISDFDDACGRDILLAIEKRCRDNDIMLMLARSESDQRIEENILEDMISHGVVGIIIMPVQGVYYSAKLLQLVLDGFPLVVIDRELRGIPAHFVGTDNVKAAEEAMDYLIGTGHKDIGVYTMEVKKTSSLEDRMEGIHRSLKKHNTTLDPVLFFSKLKSTASEKNQQELFEQDKKVVREHLLSHKNIKAVIALEYYVALVLSSVISDLNLSVPNDIEIVCFDSPKLHYYTHMRQDQAGIGEKAVDLVLDILNNDTVEGAIKIAFPAKMVFGDSTSPIKKLNLHSNS